MSYATTKHQTSLASTSDVRFRSSTGSEQIGINTTIRRIDKFRQQYGEQCLHLACHAALPVVLNAELLHLLRINFFFDPPASLPYTAEADVLLSVLCSAIDEDLYEIEAEVRDALLHTLLAEYGPERVRELATLLWQYTQRCTPWLERPGLVEAQQLTALNFLDAGKAKEWLAQAEFATKATGQANHAWFVAMRREIARDDLSLRVAFEYLQNLGRQQGYVTYDDVLEAMPGIEERDLTQVEDLFAALFEEGIEVGQVHEIASNESSNVIDKIRRDRMPKDVSSVIETTKDKIISQNTGTVIISQNLDTLELDSELYTGLTEEVIERIRKILMHNVGSGRASHVMSRITKSESNDLVAETSTKIHGQLTKQPWYAYQEMVIRTYLQEAARINALAQRDNETWRMLGAQLTDGAYNLLVQKGIDADLAGDLALDMAQQTCYKIYVSAFPCDIPFNTWAHVILKNQILHQLTRSNDMLDRQPYIDPYQSLQTEQKNQHNFTPIGQINADPWYPVFSSSNQLEDRDWLSEAITQLPSAERRAVIVYTFFYDLSDDEIAQKLGKSKGAVHTLRHRALKQLRGILDETFELPANFNKDLDMALDSLNRQSPNALL